jgi:hypothetical protein
VAQIDTGRNCAMAGSDTKCYDPERIGCRRCAQHGENGCAASRERAQEEEERGT